MPHRRMRVTQVEEAASNEHGEVDGTAGTSFDDIHIAPVRPGGAGGGHPRVRGCANATEHGTVWQSDFVAPVNLAVADAAHVRAVRTVVTKPLAKLFWIAGMEKIFPVVIQPTICMDRRAVSDRMPVS